MNLVDLKIPKKTKKEMEAEMKPIAAYEDQDRYPYGLCLSFGKDEVEKVEALKKLNAGDQVMIQGVGYVKEVSISESGTGEGKEKTRHRVEIQITSVGVEGKKRPQDMDMKEYAKSRGKSY